MRQVDPSQATKSWQLDQRHIRYCAWPRIVRKQHQAKDIDTKQIVALVGRLVREKNNWLWTQEVAEHYPHLPFKVVHAKLSRLMRRGQLRGCPCGCRGDWEPIEDYRT